MLDHKFDSQRKVKTKRQKETHRLISVVCQIPLLNTGFVGESFGVVPELRFDRMRL